MTALLPADIHALIERLRYYNAWRRGGEGRQPDPEQIGRDIDAAVAILSRQTCAPDPLSQALNEGDGVYRP